MEEIIKSIKNPYSYRTTVEFMKYNGNCQYVDCDECPFSEFKNNIRVCHDFYEEGIIVTNIKSEKFIEACTSFLYFITRYWRVM